jgi:hypothetical protein
MKCNNCKWLKVEPFNHCDNIKSPCHKTDITHAASNGFGCEYGEKKEEPLYEIKMIHVKTQMEERLEKIEKSLKAIGNLLDGSLYKQMNLRDIENTYALNCIREIK